MTVWVKFGATSVGKTAGGFRVFHKILFSKDLISIPNSPFPPMRIYLQLMIESFRFAWEALRSNLLRTVLSLLGVTIGIFAIIAVFVLVDSLEKNVKDNLSFLGSRTVYVQKWPFVFSNNFPWWKYMNRPTTKEAEYKFLESRLTMKEAIALFDQNGGITLKNGSNSIGNIAVLGATESYQNIVEIPMGEGRFFNELESEASRQVAIVGADIVEALFAGMDPIGKTLKLDGQKFVVIGTMKKQGESILGGPDFDVGCFIPYGTFDKLYHTKNSNPTICIKGLETDPGMEELEAEITGLMRTRRGLKPTEEDDFSINRTEQVVSAVEGIFGALYLGGAVISGFSLLVGGFGIANIMFVSVRERTNIIGIQKSLGAKNSFILYQFLFEAVFLSILGGFAGLLMVYLLTLLPLGSLELVLRMQNVVIGLGVSAVIGTLSGIIPAAMAARLDPVTAIRAK